MRHIKSNSLRARLLLSFAFVGALVAVVSAGAYEQAPQAKSNTTHLKLASDVLEDVYFNAQASELVASSSLGAKQFSATSIGSVLTLLFDSAKVSLQTENDPLATSWSGTVTIPINTAAKPKPGSYLQHIRGSLMKTKDSRVTIFLNLGGKSSVVEFPYGRVHNGDVLQKLVSPVKAGSQERYTASITIFVERRNKKSAVAIDIDSIDVDAR
ncbi:MAG TPA: hypothetical protein VFR78_20655 [Pyrinomonadaceae bacterium]|nr:hypothetical protein [Pyrinomonadaceae bacterium]